LDIANNTSPVDASAAHKAVSCEYLLIPRTSFVFSGAARGFRLDEKGFISSFSYMDASKGVERSAVIDGAMVNRDVLYSFWVGIGVCWRIPNAVVLFIDDNEESSNAIIGGRNTIGMLIS